MSVKDLNKVFIITDMLNGEIIETIRYDETYRVSTIEEMIKDIIDKYVWEEEHGITIKIGYKP